MLNKIGKRLWQISLLSLLFLTGCASLQNAFQTPSVSLVSVTPLQASGFEQQFEVGLRVTNPNPKALKLVGINCALELEGVKVLKGVVSDVPGIAAYSDELVTMTVSIGLLEGLKFLQQFMSNNSNELGYKLMANLDTGLPFIGSLPVVESGVINLSDLGR